MELEQLNCNNCGAPLSVPETANFVSCNHCATRLAIRRTPSATFTEKLETIESKQDEMLEKITSLERQNKLATIDRNWERERQRYMISDKQGNRHEPNEALAIFGGVAACVMGVVWMVFTMGSPMGGGMAMFGLLFIGVGIAASVYGWSKAKEFEAAKRRYRRRRRDVLRTKSDSDTQFSQLKHIPTPKEYLERLEDE